VKKKQFGHLLLVAALLAFGITPGAQATICDDDPAAILYEPTVEPAGLNRVLNMLGEIPIVDFSLEQPFVENFVHTLNLVMNGAIDLSGVDFAVTPGPGSIEVDLNLPSWDSDMFITVSHDPCRDCNAEYAGCTGPCYSTYDACVIPCDPNYNACVANCDPGPLYDLCVGICDVARDTCWGGCTLQRDACITGCGVAKAGCDLNVAACNFEANFLDAFLDGHTIGMSFDSGTVSQVADVCVTGDCQAVHPYVSTSVNLVNLHVEYFPEDDPLGIGIWLNDKVTGMVSGMMDPSEIIEEYLVNDELEDGLLVSAFSADIKNDGCAPVQEVKDCKGAACSITTSPDVSTRQRASILLYLLPMLIMGGLILWRRKW